MPAGKIKAPPRSIRLYGISDRDVSLSPAGERHGRVTILALQRGN